MPALRVPSGEIPVEELERLSAVEVANYPLDCRARFLALTAKCQTASSGRLRHFIYPEADVILDDVLLWWEVFGEGEPFTFPK